MESHFLFGVRVDDLDEASLSQMILGWLESEGSHRISTPNPEIILQARHDHDLRELLNGSDLCVPDGVGLQYAVAALTDGQTIHRHTGVDVFLELVRVCEQQQRSLLLVGGKPGSAGRSAAVLQKAFPTLNVQGFDPGLVEGGAGHIRCSPDVFDLIAQELPDVLAVGLGVGKQEEFVLRAQEYVPDIKIGIGVGGAFEMIAGTLVRAPEKWRRVGLEWVWRLSLEPSRIGRILRAVGLFPLLVAWDTIRQRRFIKACKQVFPQVFRQMKGL